MDDLDTAQYERVRARRAKLLVADFFSQLESLAKQGPSQEELVRSADTIFLGVVLGAPAAGAARGPAAGCFLVEVLFRLAWAGATVV